MTFGLARQMDAEMNITSEIGQATEISLDDIPAAAKRVVEMAMRDGIPYSLRRLPAANLSPELIAESCGTELPLVARTTLYRGLTTKKPVLIISSATTLVNARTLAQLVGEVLVKADAASVERVTGFAPDALPPIGLVSRVPIMMDDALIRFGRIWCMAGAPDLVMTSPTTTLARAIAARMAKLD
ncbi:MAG: aminoacyl-tRNA deacylase [Rhabdaerophilum sp.]